MWVVFGNDCCWHGPQSEKPPPPPPSLVFRGIVSLFRLNQSANRWRNKRLSSGEKWKQKKIFFVPPEEFDFSPEFFIPRHGFSGVDYGSYEQQEKPAKVVGEVVLCVLPRVEVRTLCLFFGWMCPRSMNYWVRRDLRFVVLLRLIPKFITFRLHCFTGAQRKEPGYLMWGGGW